VSTQASEHNEELTLTHNGSRDFRPTDRPQATNGRKDRSQLQAHSRKRDVWSYRKTTQLSKMQKESLDTLYSARDVNLTPNLFSLSATLALFPDLRDAFIPDDDLTNSQLQHEAISNRPALYLQATREVDPFA